MVGGRDWDRELDKERYFTSSRKEAWGREERGDATTDKDKMIEELHAEVRRVKDKYNSLKTRNTNNNGFPHYSPTSTKKHRRYFSADNYNNDNSKVTKIYDNVGNVILDPTDLERTVVELQNKVKKIQKYLPDY